MDKSRIAQVGFCKRLSVGFFGVGIFLNFVGIIPNVLRWVACICGMDHCRSEFVPKQGGIAWLSIEREFGLLEDGS